MIDNFNSNVNPEKKVYKTITPFKMFIKGYFPFIEDTMEAVDNYGLLSKVVEYLNNVISNENTTIDNINTLYQAFTNLKNEVENYINTEVLPELNEKIEYIDNYFENLDVQAEINNKLDSMVQDGSLYNLIKPYLDNLSIELTQRLNEQDSKINLIESGSPLVASSTAEMTNTSRIYVNTTDGNWYYYDGTNWNIGGVYLSDIITNLYTEVAFTQNNQTFEIDTANNTIQVGACRFIFKQVGYSLSQSNLIGIPTSGTVTCYLYYDTATDTYGINPYTINPSSSYAILLIFDRRDFSREKISYHGWYIVDNNIINDKYIDNYANVYPTLNSPLLEFTTGSSTVLLHPCSFYNKRTGNNLTIGGDRTLDYSNVGGTFVAIAYDIKNDTCLVGTPSTYINKEQYLIFAIFRKNLTINSGISYQGNIVVDGRSKFDFKTDLTLYVSENGNDSTGTGTILNPYKTISKALTFKPTELYVTKGEYEIDDETINWDLKINGLFDTYNEITNPKYDKPILYGGKKLNPQLDLVTNLLKVPYSSSSNNIIYKVFVSQELPVDTGGTRPAYNVTLWLSDADNKINDIKLIPVLTLELCQNTDNSFYYDGTDIYINDNTNFNNKRYILSINDLTQHCLSINKSKIEITNIAFRYAYQSNVNIGQNSIGIFNNCEFGNSSSSDGITLDYSNSYLYNCDSYKNRNDGFSIHNFSNTHFYNCNGYYNEDDGISHHDGTVGYIEGGEWYHNGKGGIASPTYGAKINISNVYSHDNVFGILAVSTNLVSGNILLNNCLLKNNTTDDLYNNNYNIIAYNIEYDTKETAGDGSIIEY